MIPELFAELKARQHHVLLVVNKVDCLRLPTKEKERQSMLYRLKLWTRQMARQAATKLAENRLLFRLKVAETARSRSLSWKGSIASLVSLRMPPLARGGERALRRRPARVPQRLGRERA